MSARRVPSCSLLDVTDEGDLTGLAIPVHETADRQPPGPPRQMPTHDAGHDGRGVHDGTHRAGDPGRRLAVVEQPVGLVPVAVERLDGKDLGGLAAQSSIEVELDIRRIGDCLPDDLAGPHGVDGADDDGTFDDVFGSEETLANQHLYGAVLDEYFRERLHLGTVEVAMAKRFLRSEVPRLDDVIVVQKEAFEAHRDELERHVAADAAAPDDGDG